MSFGVFVQMNEGSRRAETQPIGYVVQENGCWEWVGGTTRDGYGLFRPNGGKTQRVHVWLYEQRYGPISDGKECHHTCPNKICVNPDHIEIVTHKEHYDRDRLWQEGLARGSRFRLAKTHCPQGHPYSGENLYVRPDTYRECRTCHRDAVRRSYQKTRAGRKC